ncbi:hypothetical protein HRbin11_01170 [bacterium HR11]|nr:hypothetical protein HRbin11_01170 [bacterium HR11]
MRWLGSVDILFRLLGRPGPADTGGGRRHDGRRPDGMDAAGGFETMAQGCPQSQMACNLLITAVRLGEMRFPSGKTETVARRPRFFKLVKDDTAMTGGVQRGLTPPSLAVFRWDDTAIPGSVRRGWHRHDGRCSEGIDPARTGGACGGRPQDGGLSPEATGMTAGVPGIDARRPTCPSADLPIGPPANCPSAECLKHRAFVEMPFPLPIALLISRTALLSTHSLIAHRSTGRPAEPSTDASVGSRDSPSIGDPPRRRPGGLEVLHPKDVAPLDTPQAGDPAGVQVPPEDFVSILLTVAGAPDRLELALHLGHRGDEPKPGWTRR